MRGGQSVGSIFVGMEIHQNARDRVAAQIKEIESKIKPIKIKYDADTTQIQKVKQQVESVSKTKINIFDAAAIEHQKQINAQMTEFKKRVNTSRNEIQSQLVTTEQGVKALQKLLNEGKQMRQLGINAGWNADQMNKLNQGIAQASRSLNYLQGKNSPLSFGALVKANTLQAIDALNLISPQINALVSLSAQIRNSVRAAAPNINVSSKSSSTASSSASAAAAAQAVSVSAAQSNASAAASITNVGRAAGASGAAISAAALGVAAALAAVGGSMALITSNTAKFETALKDAKLTLSATESQMSQLATAAESIGMEFGITGTEVAKVFAQLGTSGVSLEQALNGVSQAAIVMSRATGESAQITSSIASQVAQNFTDVQDDFSKIADISVNTANNTRLSIADLNDAIGQGGRGVAIAGLSYSNFAAAVSLVRPSASSASDAATALSNAITRLYAPTATGKEILDKWGVSAYDAQGRARQFPDVLRDLERATKSQTDQQKNANLQIILGNDGLKGILPLLRAGADGYEDLSAKLEKTGTGLEAAKDRTNTLQGSLDKLKAAFNNLFTEDPKNSELVKGLTAILNLTTKIITTMDSRLNARAAGLNAIDKYSADNNVSKTQAAKDLSKQFNIPLPNSTKFFGVDPNSARFTDPQAAKFLNDLGDAISKNTKAEDAYGKALSKNAGVIKSNQDALAKHQQALADARAEQAEAEKIDNKEKMRVLGVQVEAIKEQIRVEELLQKARDKKYSGDTKGAQIKADIDRAEKAARAALNAQNVSEYEIQKKLADVYRQRLSDLQKIVDKQNKISDAANAQLKQDQIDASKDRFARGDTSLRSQQEDLLKKLKVNGFSQEDILLAFEDAFGEIPDWFDDTFFPAIESATDQFVDRYKLVLDDLQRQAAADQIPIDYLDKQTRRAAGPVANDLVPESESLLEQVQAINDEWEATGQISLDSAIYLAELYNALDGQVGLLEEEKQLFDALKRLLDDMSATIEDTDIPAKGGDIGSDLPAGLNDATKNIYGDSIPTTPSEDALNAQKRRDQENAKLLQDALEAGAEAISSSITSAILDGDFSQKDGAQLAGGLTNIGLTAALTPVLGPFAPLAGALGGAFVERALSPRDLEKEAIRTKDSQFQRLSASTPNLTINLNNDVEFNYTSQGGITDLEFETKTRAVVRAMVQEQEAMLKNVKSDNGVS